MSRKLALQRRQDLPLREHLYRYNLRPWISPDRLDWRRLSANPHPMAVQMLFDNRDKIDFRYLSRNNNPAAVDLMRTNVDALDWAEISANSCTEAALLLMEYPHRIVKEVLAENHNPLALKLLPNIDNDTYVRTALCINRSEAALQILRDNPALILWEPLSSNPLAMDMLLAKPANINYTSMSLNPHPKAVELLQTNEYYFRPLSQNGNPTAIELLRQHRAMIVWHILARNPATTAVELMRECPLYLFSPVSLARNSNPLAMELLAQNSNLMGRYDFAILSSNRNIFEDEYPPACRAYFRKEVAAELMAVVWHPRNMSRFADLGVDVDVDAAQH